MTELRAVSTRRASRAVYAVATGDRLGLDLASLRRLRAAAESSATTGDSALDAILAFVDALATAGVLGALEVPPELARSAGIDPQLARAYEEVAPMIQPLD